MKFLHTSDWHLGRSLYGRKRHDEFAAFLDWLHDIIDARAIDALLICGDIFDSSTPGNRTQELYYRFLCGVAASRCRHVVVTAGNHDSPSLLDAPKELLRALDIHVVGAMASRPEDEVITLKDGRGMPQAIVCAVPYLRDRDIRIAQAGESIEEKDARLVEGMRRHYAEVCDVAVRLRREYGVRHGLELPLLAMGHLFTAGGRTSEGDGVRELYVGSLAHVGRDIFPSAIDYLALGHLHVPQMVGGAAHLRYCGSPLPMGFGEAQQQKKVVEVAWQGRRPVIVEVPVPCFQSLRRLVGGSLEEILGDIARLKAGRSRAWLEIEYTGAETVGNLRQLLDEALGDSLMEIRRIRNSGLAARVLQAACEEEALDDLDPHDVFVRCLDAHGVPPAERADLLRGHAEIVQSLQEEDRRVE